MKFTFYHNNINVFDLDKSIEFYQKALGLTVTREKSAEDGSFKLVFLGDETTPHLLELTWLRDMELALRSGRQRISPGHESRRHGSSPRPSPGNGLRLL